MVIQLGQFNELNLLESTILAPLQLLGSRIVTFFTVSHGPASQQSTSTKFDTYANFFPVDHVIYLHLTQHNDIDFKYLKAFLPILLLTT